MSSILEALKELESERARAAKKTTSVVDMPPEPERTSLGAFIPLAGGLALGVVVFGVYLWTAGGDPLPPTSSPSTLEQPADRPAAPGPREPDWLSRAEPPRARVAPPPAPAPAAAPARAAATGEREPAASAPARPAAAAPAAAEPARPARAAGRGDVRLESLAFSSHVGQRTVTLLVDGRRATLHQGESLGGVEVQLIMADGAYLRRGGDVFFVGKPR